MALPFAIPAALYAMKLISDYSASKKSDKYNKEMEAAQKKRELMAEKARKRAALASAVGYNDPTYTRKVENPNAPDLSTNNLVSGLGGFGSNIASQYLADSPASPGGGGVDDILAGYPSALKRRFNPYG